MDKVEYKLSITLTPAMRKNMKARHDLAIVGRMENLDFLDQIILHVMPGLCIIFERIAAELQLLVSRLIL